MPEKLKCVKFIESVMLDNLENRYYSDEKTEITLDGMIIKLVSKRSKKNVCSHLLNVISFEIDDGIKPAVKGK
jgi:hypothetical protein